MSPLSIWIMVAIKWQLNIDWADKEHARLLSLWSRCLHFKHFEAVLAYCTRVTAGLHVWRGCCLRRFSCPSVWTAAAVRGWEDTGSAVGDFSHYCAHVFGFYKACSSAVKMDSFGGLTFSNCKFEQFSTSLSWHLYRITLFNFCFRSSIFLLHLSVTCLNKFTIFMKKHFHRNLFLSPSFPLLPPPSFCLCSVDD